MRIGLNKTTARLWSGLGPFFFVLLFILWFNGELIWDGKVPFFRDLATYHYPNRFLLAQSFRAWEIPFWNSHVSTGFPFAANPQAGVFYPPHMIFFLLGFFDAIRVLFVFHYLVAASGAYLLGRHWGYPPYIALAGSILFSLSGIVVSLENMLDYFQTAVWLPWILLYGERWLQSTSKAGWLPLALVVLVQLLAGHPETFLMSLGILFLDGLRIKAEDVGMTYRTLLLKFASVLGPVLGLAMAQILPSVELFMHSGRAAALSYEKAVVWSLKPLNLLNLFFLDKEVDLQLFNGLRPLWSPEPPLLLSLYVGPVTLCGFLFFCFGAGRKERLILSALMLGFLLLALGGYTPLHGLLYSWVPYLQHVRFPEKLLLPFFLLLLYGALRGLHRLHEQDFKKLTLPLSILGLVVLLEFFLYLFFRFDREALGHVLAWAKGTEAGILSLREEAVWILFSLESQILVTFSLFLLVVLWKRQRVRPGIFQVLLLGLAVFDLSSAHRPYHFALPPDLVEKTSPLISPSGERVRLFYLLRPGQLHPNVYAFAKRPFEGMVAAAFANLIPNTGVFYGFDYVQELDSLRKGPYDALLTFGGELPADRLYQLLGALNVQYINSFGPLPPGEITLVRHALEYPSWLYRLNRVVPRAYVAGEVVVEKGTLPTLQHLSSEGFDPSRQVVLERPLGLSQADDLQARVKIESYGHHQVKLRVSLARPGVLVLADSFYPGWQVYVNGEEKEVLRANFFFRAVPLLPGNHLVEFQYKPWSFMVGAIISLATLVAVASWALCALLRKKKELGSAKDPERPIPNT